MEKTWRMTKDEFYSKVKDFADRRYIEILRDVKKGGDIIKGDGNLRMLRKLVGIVNNPESSVKDIYKAKLSIASMDMKDWVEFSTHKQSFDDIMLRFLLTCKQKDTNNALSFLCISYTLEFSEPSEEFIKDMLFVESDLFDFDKWDDAHVEFVNKLSSIKKKNLYDDLNMIKNYCLKNLDDNNKKMIEQIDCIIQSSNKKMYDKIASHNASISGSRQQIKLLNNAIKLLNERKEIVIDYNKMEIHTDLDKQDLYDELIYDIYDTVTRESLHDLIYKNQNKKDIIDMTDYEYIITSMGKAIPYHENNIKKKQRLVTNLKRKGPVYTFKMCDRLDWVNITKNRNVSKEFINSHRHLMVNV